MQQRKPSPTKLHSYVVTFAALAGFAWSSAALAINPQPDPPGFGLVGMVPGQTTQFHAVCSNLPSSQFPPGPCRGQLAFVDATGKTLKRTNIALQAGHSASLELAATGEGRMAVRPVILLNQGSGLLIPTVEIFDSETGRTALVVSPVNFRPAAKQ